MRYRPAKGHPDSPAELEWSGVEFVGRLAPCPAHFSAQTLVHEATHNKFSSILDLFSLATNGPEE